jgi:hypothetical protein
MKLGMSRDVHYSALEDAVFKEQADHGTTHKDQLLKA